MRRIVVLASIVALLCAAEMAVWAGTAGSAPGGGHPAVVEPRIAAGSSHSLTIKADGSLYAWGSNEYGQLGIGTTDGWPSTPIRVGKENDWVAVTAGDYHTMALKSDGSLYAWGSNLYGQLGDGTTVNRLSPTRVGAGNDWAAVACGCWSSYALKSDGSLWGWGSNSSGCLGLGTADPWISTPTRVGTESDWAAVSGGHNFTIAIKSDGSLYAWGENGAGQLGIGTQSWPVSTPTLVGADKDWAAVACGCQFTVALKSDGSLFAWGYNGSGQLGLGTTDDYATSPTAVGTANDWVAVAAGTHHTLALKSDGSLFAWGWNGHGQLGDGTTVDKNSPIRIGSDNDWAAVAAGYGHSVALKSDASLYAWGFSGAYLTPTEVPLTSSSGIWPIRRP